MSKTLSDKRKKEIAEEVLLTLHSRIDQFAKPFEVIRVSLKDFGLYVEMCDELHDALGQIEFNIDQICDGLELLLDAHALSALQQEADSQ